MSTVFSFSAVFFKKVLIDNLKFRRICIKFSVSRIAVTGTLSSRKFLEIWFIPETLGTSTFFKPLTLTGTPVTYIFKQKQYIVGSWNK